MTEDIETESHGGSTANNHQEIHMAEFELEGFCCVRFFDPLTGALRVYGPEGSRKARRRYVRKYERLCRNQGLKEYLAKMRPETPINVKLHAVLHLMAQHDDEAIRQGVAIDPDVLFEVVDSFGPWKPFDPKTCH
jgi:hypothetical protein